jgi:uncharacterized protein YegL
MSNLNIIQNYVTDVIVILDHSVSMVSMGKEPIQSVNVFLKEQKINCIEDEATFTLVTFDSKSRVITDHIPIKDIDDIMESIYNPSGGTALNDALCFTIEKELKLSNPDNKIVLIITDGEENSSKYFSTDNTRDMVSNCQENHNWEFIFIGANIDVFSCGNNINIKRSQCSEFSQKVYGDLFELCRQTSFNVASLRRERTYGSNIHKLVAPRSIDINTSAPIDIPQPKGYSLLPIMRSSAVPIEYMYQFFGGNYTPSPVD